ncbi:MAG: hypothetical protein BWY70_00107 [Bacteroidetes bacterium ADurb.Bin408]|nr:MAG: hypothetical protein BWY70_00107 [Bacteroidetes bacterium ADurb.Bin408]
MKLIIRMLLVAFIAAQINTSAQAQKLFSGTIEYEITYPDADLDPATAASLPKSLTMTISGKKSRVDMTQGVMNIIKINNAETNSSVSLLDIMGQKYALKTSKEELEKALNEMPKAKITVTEETKEIAGYKATKATIVFTNEDGTETTEEIYFSPEIGGENFNFDTPYKDIKGGLLQYSVESSDIKMLFTAKEIKSKKIKDTMFMIPTDYQEVTAEELQNIFGGME